MKPLFLTVLLLLTLLPLAAQEEKTASSARERVYIGMVADEREGEAAPGVLVRAVAPGSPAQKAGVCVGDVVLKVGGSPTNKRSDLRRVVADGRNGAVLTVELLRSGKPLRLQVVLEPRPLPGPLPPRQEQVSLGADRYMHPINLSDDIRQEIRRHRHLLREQLAALPDGLEPAFVTAELNAIRNLARDARAERSEWMSGRAGEISVRFRDAEGSVVIYGANNLVTLELYDELGQLRSRHNLNTQEERRALPESVLERLRAFR